MDEIKGKIKSPLEKENLEIIRSQVGAMFFVFDLKNNLLLNYNSSKLLRKLERRLINSTKISQPKTH